jgi:hypothetical protein
MYPPSRPTTIQFGISTAQSRVGEIRGHGLLGVIYVVEGDLPLVLISDITSPAGVICCKTTAFSWHSRQKVVLRGQRSMGTETHGAGTVAARRNYYKNQTNA